ncbi:hypothetical protein B7494_g2936 [Chlorociboria aeruginascens]|nr:hypothetical protein B7494_g2936 [Chlorociboria aeruginascens]
MISNILAITALVSTVMAACPLSVAITGTNDHVAQVAVTNTGSETITVFKGNTVLSDHATKDLLVAGADGTALPFEGIFVNYKRTNLSPELFQTLQPGESVTASVNAARTYNLAGIETAQVTAIQGFKYVTGSTAPTALKDTTFCEDVSSGTVTITPDQSKVVTDKIAKRGSPFSSRIQKRAVTYSSCSSSQTSSLKTSVADAISLATAAYTAAATAADYFTVWFKSTSEESKVRSIYNDVKGVQTTSPEISCADIYGDCADGSALLYTVPSDNTIVPCTNNGFWGFPELSPTCANDDYDKAGSILHEMTHLYGTEDYAYGPTAAKQLSAAQAAANADTYEMYSESYYLVWPHFIAAMGLASDALYFTLHPNQLWMITQWKLRHRPIHERNEHLESATAKVCFKFLDQTGRSFAAVVEELHPELLMPVCVFYLILRGLDTIEDDTSIPIETKEPLLRNFKNFLDQDGWTFTGNRPEEKDRELLVQFDNVITEFRNVKPAYQAILKDITGQMGNGMADFARKAAFGDFRVNTVEEYNLYCWYVAGVVGEGLTYLFVEAGLGDAALIKHTHLYKSMGLLLQKNNIIRDIREDHDDGRCFWPKEIWSKHVDNFEDLFKPEKRELALNCSSEMVLNALGHAQDCLSFLMGVREQSVFNFCAIPQSMALATLELCFRNPALFERNVKITKGDAVQLMLESSQDLERVCEVFCRYVHRIQHKNNPKDPNFSSIRIACEQIESFAKALAPQSVELANSKTKKKALEGQRIWSTTGRVFAILAFISILVVGIAWFTEVRFKPT